MSFWKKWGIPLILSVGGMHAGFAQIKNTLPTIEEDAPPVVINGKRADQLTSDEMQEFLQSKIRRITQDDGQLQVVRTSPGYPVTLIYEEAIADFDAGDSKLITIRKSGRRLILRPGDSTGDMPLSVFFAGNRARYYHIFVDPTFATTDTAFKVAPFLEQVNPGVAAGGAAGDRERGRIPGISHIITNYDLLLQEGSVKPQEVRRTTLARVSRITPFTYHNLYQFADGALAITFEMENQSPKGMTVDHSTLRVQIGRSRFVPDYVKINQRFLEPGEKTMGYLVLYHPPFDPRQEFELVWRKGNP